MICGEIHHTENYQNIPKVNLSQQKIRRYPIVFRLSIKSSFKVVQEKVTIICILTNDIITANQMESLFSILSRKV